MERVIFLEKDIPQLGLYTRSVTHGTEYDLVQEFIEYYQHQFLRDNKKYNLAVFIEPKIMSGFPDIVFASYLPTITNNWSDMRMQLNLHDLKVLSYLLQSQGSNGSQMITKLKLSEKQTLCSLEKLLDAKLITYRHHNWTPKNLRDIFSITKLVSIEAKINNVSRAAEQSIINTWFASHSYVLTNVSNPHNETLNVFTKQGIGLYCKKKRFKKMLEAKQLTLPSSYQSLQFNEWIGNKIYM